MCVFPTLTRTGWGPQSLWAGGVRRGDTTAVGGAPQPVPVHASEGWGCPGTVGGRRSAREGSQQCGEFGAREKSVTVEIGCGQ